MTSERFFRALSLIAMLAAYASPASAQISLPDGRTQPGSPTPVNADNFTRAESDLYFGNIVKTGGFGKFFHSRNLAPLDSQTVVRLNRDTIYSSAVFDLDAGPATITLPETNGRFMSMQIIDQDMYTPEVLYAPTTYTLDRETVGTRYVVVAVRTLVDPGKPGDVMQANALQDRIRVDQPGGPGRFEVPQWDVATQKMVRDSLLALAESLPDNKRAFGARGEVDPVRHLIGSASGWGGNPDEDATYLNVTPELNDGTTVHRLTIKEVPVDSFWSISVYKADGYFETDESKVYTINSLTAKRSDDGSIGIQFGGCPPRGENCLSISPGWNYLVRLYQPRPEILDGSWKFPEAQAVP